MLETFISDYLKLGSLRLAARVLYALRSLFILFCLGPQELGDYAVLILYIHYFAMLDCGVLYGLERDLPHFQSKSELDRYHHTANLGRSLFLTLSLAASVLLMLCYAVGIFKEGLTMGALLSTYLFFDQCYRAYESNARTLMKYREVGFAAMTVAATNLVLICFLLPLWKLHGIFASLILSSMVGIYYLHHTTPIQFKFTQDLKNAIAYCRHSLSLAACIYMAEIFHVVCLTLLALKLGRAQLGTFVFAFRIFQMGLFAFPYMFREVMRTRIYREIPKFHINNSFRILLKPLLGYVTLTSTLWIFLYWWAPWIVESFAPLYLNSIPILQILATTLPLLGAVKLFSDFLVSREMSRQFLVLNLWVAGVAIQTILLLLMFFFNRVDLTHVAFIYVFSVSVVYFAMSCYVFSVVSNLKMWWLIILYLTSPILFSVLNILLFRWFGVAPLSNFLSNLTNFGYSIMVHAFSIGGVVLIAIQIRSGLRSKPA